MQLSEVVMLFPGYKFAARSERLYILKLQHFKQENSEEFLMVLVFREPYQLFCGCVFSDCRIEMRGTGNESRLFLSWPLVRKFQWSPCIPRECPSPTHASRAHQTTPRYPYCRQGRKSFSNGCFLKQQCKNSWNQSRAAVLCVSATWSAETMEWRSTPTWSKKWC